MENKIYSPNKKCNHWHYKCSVCKKPVKTNESYYHKGLGQVHHDCLPCGMTQEEFDMEVNLSFIPVQ